MFDLSEHWYLTAWNVSNVRQKSPDNTNIFAGVGYRQDRWWLEVMAQQQWSVKNTQSMLDLRFQKQMGGRSSFYLEPTVFLNRKALYEFVIFEQRVWRRLNVGGETENVHQAGPDYLVAGPRVNWPIAGFGQWRLNGAASWRIRHHGRDEPRFYVVLNRRFKIN